MKTGSLFSGYSGLDLAVDAFFGSETVWVSDIDPGACKILAHHWPDLPNLGDITRIDWQQVEPVDILTGGFPCQDLSHAGKRAGLKPGTRSGLWSHMAYAIQQLRPRYVIAENVRGLLSASADSDLEPCPWCLGGSADGEPALRALGCVLGDLAELGYDTQWTGLRAADVGAPHGRFRIFICAADRRRPAADSRSGGGWKADSRGRHMVREGGIQSRRHESAGSPRPGRVTTSDSEPSGLQRSPLGRLVGAGVSPERRAELATDPERLGESGRGELRDLGGATPGGTGEGLQRQPGSGCR
jgi:DNA (cytosine-5)-methyltransferase 1